MAKLGIYGLGAVVRAALTPIAGSCASTGAHDGGGGNDALDGATDIFGGDGGAADGGEHSEIVFVATYRGGLWSFVVDQASGRLDGAPGSPFDQGAQLYAL